MHVMSSPHPNLPTANHANQSSGWSRLPSEVKIKIFKSLDRTTLKDCRLVNSEASAAATPILCHALCLGPSITSVIHLACFAAHVELRNFVRCIEVHPCRLQALYEGQEICTDLDVFFNKLSPHLTMKALDWWKSGHEMRRSEAEFVNTEPTKIAASINSILTRFPNLATVTCAYYHTHDMHGYYQARFESQFYRGIPMSDLSPDKCIITWPWLTVMIGDIRLKVLELRQLPWNAFRAEACLTLLFDICDLDGSTDDLTEQLISHDIEVLGKLSSHLPNVEQLWLGFHEPDAPSAYEPPQGLLGPVTDQVLQQVSLALLSGHFEKAHTITLQNLVGDEDTIISFVRRHGKKLKSLTLDGFRQLDTTGKVHHTTNHDSVTNITTATDANAIAAAADPVDANTTTLKCVFGGLLSLIEGVRAHSSLEHMKFTGSFIDVAGPAFKFGDSPTRSWIQAYVCHKGDFPEYDFGVLMKKIMNGECRACGNDVVYEQDKMELRMTLFAIVDGSRTYLPPPTSFPEGLTNALKTLETLEGLGG
ncbi:hypothetical protein H2200_011632 [Cladophialophora chaetospira]|uniref:F-box domain-containing protein n=1 Tax=Cladophialophora chaetospira TaxID=386627 RepID=A0AA38WZP4_9EURO|nr:hypothetical protein H2200_011632 [Cladophialophora chaetospira]